MPVQSDPASLLAFANAIAYSGEGFGAATNNKPTRTNNPGDLKLGDLGHGTDSGITVFPTANAGKQALLHQLQKVADGTSKSLSTDMSLSQFGTKYANGDPNWAINVAKSLNVDPSTNVGEILSGKASLVNPGNRNTNTSPQPVQANGDGLDFGRKPSDFVPLLDETNANVNVNDLFPDVIVAQDPNATAWFDDDLLTGNPNSRKFVSKVTFQLVLQGANRQLLTNPQSGKPITLELNASVRDYNIQYKHIQSIQRGRTAYHVSLWGMQADVFTASCTTGVFINQLGITDLYSTENASAEILNTLVNGFRFVLDANDGEVRQAISTNPVTPEQVVQKLTGPNAPPLTKTFRVAAQDAFIELLSLFKCNGNVWFRNQTFNQGGLASNDQAGPSAWSPQLGASSTQANARNNDVMTRGSVIMKFKNDTFLGYIKSMQFTQDANNPFQWNFNFTFQVERTLSLMLIPR